MTKQITPETRAKRMARLEQLIRACSCEWNPDEFFMWIPAQPDHDADLILSWALKELKRLEKLEAQLKHVRGVLEPCAEDLESICDAAMPFYKHANSGWRLSRRCNTNDVINVLHDRAFAGVEPPLTPTKPALG